MYESITHEISLIYAKTFYHLLNTVTSLPCLCTQHYQQVEVIPEENTYNYADVYTLLEVDGVKTKTTQYEVNNNKEQSCLDVVIIPLES